MPGASYKVRHPSAGFWRREAARHGLTVTQGDEDQVFVSQRERGLVRQRDPDGATQFKYVNFLDTLRALSR
jgi:hypothetical protein